MTQKEKKIERTQVTVQSDCLIREYQPM